MYQFTMLLGVLIGSLAQIPLKKSALDKRTGTLSYFLNVKTVVGYMMMVSASILSFISIRNLELKKAAIIETSGYIFVLIIGRAVFDEHIGARKLIAALIIVAGILVFNA